MSSRTPKHIPFAARRAITRERLIAAASRAVVENGFEVSSLDDVAARAGLTKGAIYDNFASKDELMSAVVMAWPNGVDAFPWPKGRNGTLSERMSRLGRAFVRHLRTAETEARIRAELTAYVVTHPTMRALLADHNADWMRRTEVQLAQLVAPDELTIPMMNFAIAVDALMTGLLFSHFQVPQVVDEKAIESAFQSLAGPKPATRR